MYMCIRICVAATTESVSPTPTSIYYNEIGHKWLSMREKRMEKEK